MILLNLEQFFSGHGIEAVGVGDLDALRKLEPEAMTRVPKEFSRGIVFGIRLEDAVVDQIEDKPTLLYFHMYRQANFSLDRAAFKLALELQRSGHRAIAIPASQITEPGGRRGMVSHRLIGYAAGIGWIGRPTILVHPEFGARLRYATVLTNAPYEPAEPLEYQCGNCQACVKACPVGAIKEYSREFDLDSCYAKLSEFRKLPFIGQHVCGICIKACHGQAGVT